MGNVLNGRAKPIRSTKKQNGPKCALAQGYAALLSQPFFFVLFLHALAAMARTRGSIMHVRVFVRLCAIQIAQKTQQYC